MKHKLILVLLSSLIGCTTPMVDSNDETIKTVNEYNTSVDYHLTLTSQQTADTQEPTAPKSSDVECPKFELPETGDIPIVPNIESSRQDDYRYITNVLIGHIQELTEYTQQYVDRVSKNYADYRRVCDTPK